MHRKVSVYSSFLKETVTETRFDVWSGYAVVGGQDMVINIFILDSANKEDPEYSLVGHTDNVCALHVGPAGIIISGSWDR